MFVCNLISKVVLFSDIVLIYRCRFEPGPCNIVLATVPRKHVRIVASGLCLLNLGSAEFPNNLI